MKRMKAGLDYPKSGCWKCGSILKANFKCAEDMEAAPIKAPPVSDAVARIKRYLAIREIQPLRGLTNDIHVIHPGTDFEAVLRLDDIKVLVKD